MAGAHGRLLMTRDAALLAGVQPATIRRWVKRGILTPARRGPDGSMWFRWGDIDEAEHTARTRDRTGRAARRITGSC